MFEHKVPLSVVIITKNEEKRLVPCLESVAWADEIIVLDDESADRTAQIADDFGAKVIKRKMDVEGTHRNFGYAQAKNDWVLSLDADERVTPELRDEIIELFKKGFSTTGYNIPRRNYIGDYWVRYGGWYPSSQMKLFRKDKFKWEEVEVHPRAFLQGVAGFLKNDIIHYSYRDFSDFLNKVNKQTTWEAKKWVDDKRPMGLFKAGWRAIDRFYRTYYSKQAKKDGFMGFMVAFFAAFYQIASYAKYWEAKQLKREVENEHHIS
jgi:glycosyltransferase involved in cell wall biosynthesis